MKAATPVLSPVNKARKRRSSSKQPTSGGPDGAQPGAQPVDEKLLTDIRASLTTLPTCSAQVVNTRVHEYLTSPTTDDKHMLDAWERCGRNDYKRRQPVKFRHVEREVLSALGIACLIRYARGYLDEAEAAVVVPHSRD